MELLKIEALIDGRRVIMNKATPKDGKAGRARSFAAVQNDSIGQIDVRRLSMTR